MYQCIKMHLVKTHLNLFQVISLIVYYEIMDLGNFNLNQFRNYTSEESIFEF